MRFIRTVLFSTFALTGTFSHVATAESVSRVIPLTPALAELVSEFKSGNDKIIAVTEYADFPAELAKKEKIGGYHHLNYERIKALKPDLLIVAEGGNAPFEVETLRKQHKGIEFLLLKENSFADLLRNVQTIGAKLDAKLEAEALKNKWNDRYLTIAARAKFRETKSVVILVDENPLLVAGGPTYLTEILNWIGAKNTFAELKVKYPRLSKEELLRQNPDVIVTFGRALSKSFLETFKNVRAVKENRVFPVKNDALARPGPRMLEAAEILENLIYPKLNPSPKG